MYRMTRHYDDAWILDVGQRSTMESGLVWWGYPSDHGSSLTVSVVASEFCVTGFFEHGPSVRRETYKAEDFVINDWHPEHLTVTH